jgi:hypothetical protein
VNRLRDMLGDSCHSPAYVETIPRRGYRWLMPVDVVRTAAPDGERESVHRAGTGLRMSRDVVAKLALAGVAALMASGAVGLRVLDGRLPDITRRPSSEESSRILAAPGVEGPAALHPSDAYVKGASIRANRSPSDWRTKVGYLELAISRDPGLATAHAELSRAYVTAAWRGFAPAVDALSIARVSALESLRLDDHLANAHVALGDVRLSEWDWIGADSEYRRALALQPGHESAMQGMSRLLAYARRFDESIALRIALATRDPVDPAKGLGVALAYIQARRFGQALDVLGAAKARATAPDRDLGIHQAIAYAGKADCVNAMTSADSTLPLADEAGTHDIVLLAAAWVYATCGRGADARALLARYESPARQVPPDPISLAALYGALGETERGIQLIERGVNERSPVAVCLDTDFMLDPLRSDPRFEPLAVRVRGARDRLSRGDRTQ